MADLGLNCLRQAIGVNEVYDARQGLKAQGLKNWDIFIGMAEKHGIYLMPVGGYLGGNDWFDVGRLADSGRCLDESCAFWAAFVGHYAGHPAIWAWDLRNELLYDEQEHMIVDNPAPQGAVGKLLKEGWPEWLKVRYGSLAALNQAHGGQYARFEEVPGAVRFIEKPFDLGAYDFRCYLNDRGYLWCKRQCDTIRAAGPGQMIVSGNNGWLSPDQDLWLRTGFTIMRSRICVILSPITRTRRCRRCRGAAGIRWMAGRRGSIGSMPASACRGWTTTASRW